MANHAGPAGGWKRLARKACVPSYFCIVVAVAWLVAWLYILVGAAIIMAIENPTRREPEATSLFQGELSYLDGTSSFLH
jgi:cellulose synthase/poly-beta-1,6-N-acetylglucosamine synthase-like glycosyltransferase